MERFIVKNGHQKSTSYGEIGLCAHVLVDTILGFIDNTIGRTYVIT